MRKLILIACGLLLVAAVGTFAQTPAAAPGPAMPTSGVRAEILNELAGLENHVMRLAETVPADKYTWRPGEGVRSVSEVYLHIAAANFNLPRLIGTQPPAGFKVQGFDTATTDKAKIVETLKQSFTHLRNAILSLSDAGAEKPVKLLGRDNTYRGVMVFMLRHMGEHLGQSIAYARVIGVVPPWTEEQQQRQQQPSKQPPKQ